jgi:hypothetical protein
VLTAGLDALRQEMAELRLEVRKDRAVGSARGSRR